MAYINLLIATPSGFWANIINAFVSFVFNYAWAVILLTICIKIILSPLDLVNKKFTRDNAKLQAKMAPQLAKLQKQYGHDKNLLNQKQAELYRSNSKNLGGSCFVMLIYLTITLVVFFTLFSSLNSMSAYKIEDQYLNLKNTYETTYTNTTGTEQEKTDIAEQAVLEQYDARNTSFLWIQNVWLADTPWKNSIMNFDQYLAIVKNNMKINLNDTEFVVYSELSTEQQEEIKADYEKVMNVLMEKRNSPNGYLLCTILAVVTAILSQYFMQKKNTKKQNQNSAENPMSAGTNKIMLILLPIFMGLITLFYNSVFSLYIIAGQLVSLLIFPITDKILDKIDDNKRKKEEEKIRVEYSRKNLK